jgi:hypothetical protein
MCQMLALNHPDSDLAASFGSDQVIAAMGAERLLTPDQVADATLTLMRWRYRFIVPTPDVLKTIADRSIGSPPGAALREVAKYMHASFRDPGLFAGPEPTTPSIPVALRIFLDWAGVVGRFVIGVWGDSEIWTPEQATALTGWVAAELMPSAPRSLGAAGGRATAFASDLAFAQAVVHSVGIRDVARGNAALRCFANAIGVPDADYAKTIVEVIDAF